MRFHHNLCLGFVVFVLNQHDELLRFLEEAGDMIEGVGEDISRAAEVGEPGYSTSDSERSGKRISVPLLTLEQGMEVGDGGSSRSTGRESGVASAEAAEDGGQEEVEGKSGRSSVRRIGRLSERASSRGAEGGGGRIESTEGRGTGRLSTGRSSILPSSSRRSIFPTPRSGRQNTSRPASRPDSAASPLPASARAGVSSPLPGSATSREQEEKTGSQIEGGDPCAQSAPVSRRSSVENVPNIGTRDHSLVSRIERLGEVKAVSGLTDLTHHDVFVSAAECHVGILRFCFDSYLCTDFGAHVQKVEELKGRIHEKDLEIAHRDSEIARL